MSATETLEPGDPTALVDGEATVVVSADTHIGPTLAQLRPYCETRHLEAFDAHASQTAGLLAMFEAAMAPSDSNAPDEEPAFPIDPAMLQRLIDNSQTQGHNDVEGRERDMDADGVAAEVIFHNSLNGQPLPFMENGLASSFGSQNGEMVGAGLQIYNRWLADFCAASPNRHAGLGMVPIFDIDATIEAMTWAKEHGLRGINWPAMRRELPQYNDPHWDPVWSAAEDLELPLCNHGGGFELPIEGPGAQAFIQLENGEFFGRRMVWWMTLAGVFHRHPHLRLVLTEQPGAWFADTKTRLDSVYYGFTGGEIRSLVPEPPSFYMDRSIYIGGSFLAHFEVEDAVANGYVGNVMWGSDYPHIEGTWRFTEDQSERGEMTRASLKMTLAGMSSATIRSVAGETATDVYGFDRAALAQIADRIAAPSPAELTRGIDELPTGAEVSFGFRVRGAWS